MTITILGRARRVLLSAAAAVALAAGLGAGQASAMSLEEALAQAYSSSPQLLAERARLRATDEGLSEANAGWRPRVSINGGASFAEDNITDVTSQGWQASITATQPLYEGGRVGAQRDIAKAQIRAGRAALRGVESQVLLDVVTAYMDVVTNESVVELARSQVELLARQRQAAQDRFDVGEITRTDVAQADARLSGAQTGLIAAQAQLAAAQAAFANVVGVPPSQLQRAPRLPALPGSQAEALAAAMEANPRLIGAREGAAAAEAGVALAISALLPNVNLQAQYQRGETDIDLGVITNSQETDSASVGVNATIPLYQGGAEYANIRQAKQGASQNRLLASQAERDVTEQISNAWDGLVSSRAAIESARQQVNANEIAFEGVRQEADVGARTTLDVLNAQQELLDSRVTLVRNTRNQYVAAYSLLAAMGRLSASDIGLAVEVYDPVVYSDEAAGKLIGVGSE